jgi:CheY-like chemotaxis protein
VNLARAGSQVSFDLVIPADLWPAELDTGQMGQVFHNVLLNARQAVPEGGVVEVRAENERMKQDAPPLNAGAYVAISVRDNGCGIAPDILPRIFDPYFTTKGTGRGLGLATAYSIVAKHRGHLGVDSTLGVGTTVRIHLPASEIAPAIQPAAVVRKGSGRILVMDDEEAIRMLLEQMLTRLGYEPECSSDGAEAIELYDRAKASGRSFAAVLLDLTVPGGMGGEEACARLRRIDPLVKLIVSSGYSDSPVMSEFHEHGFDDVIRKPYTLAELSQVMSRVVEVRSNKTTA